MGLLETFNYYYYDLADPRMKDWFVLSIWFPVLILSIYIIAVLKIVPEYMKNRPAYKLNNFIKCYNLFQVVANAYIVRELSSCYPFHRALECREFVYSMTPCDILIMNVAKFGVLIKILDLIETVIYLLRKKNNQVTFLHMYHHISTALLGMTFPRYFSVEVTLSVPILNCSVHVIMYSYYFLSNWEGPIKQMVTPFKRYITIMQMAQFAILMFQSIFYFAEDCILPKIPLFIIVLNIMFNFCLFFNFYKKTYIDGKNKKF